MTFGARHLSEDGLFDCYLAEQAGESMEPPAAEHLADCTECTTRYAGLRRFMDGLRIQADADVDEAFPAERLHAQQQQIARRIELLAHPARVISFPRHAAASRTISAPARVVPPRWVMATAAAGLAIGAAVGSVFYPARVAIERPQARVASAAPVVAQQAVVKAKPAPSGDIEFINELELALERPHTRELVALDELTPHVREVYELR
jgi:hypothetical protein